MTVRRIAYVLKIFPKLSETFIAGELAELRRRGIEVRVLSLLPPREALCHEIVAEAGLEALTTYGANEFSTVIRQFQPDLLHAHFATESTAAARELAAEHKLPFTFTAHGYDLHRKPPADFSARAAAAGAVVTVSQANAEYIERVFSVPHGHIRVIGCGVDTERFRPLTRLKATLSPSEGERVGVRGQAIPIILCVARHVKVKNLPLLLEACAQLQKSKVNFRCAMIGDGPCRAELEAMCARLGLSEVVEMPGAAEQSEVLRWWQSATIGVLTSDNEGMPVSLMEAAACGVPAVATAVGGVPELVGDGVTGLLTAPGDVKALASALGRLLGDSRLREQMGKAARQRAEARFSVRQQVDKLLALWTEVLEGGPKA